MTLVTGDGGWHSKKNEFGLVQCDGAEGLCRKGGER